MGLDLEQHLLRAMAFSHATWGPGPRTKGIVEHIRKELDEVLASGGSPEEWTDVVILALDGLTRSLAFSSKYAPNTRAEYPRGVAADAAWHLENKQDRNEMRTWPDWRGKSQDEAIEHDRSKDVHQSEAIKAV